MKARKNILFLLFCSVLTLGIVWTYGTFKAHFENGAENVRLAEDMEQQAKLQKEEVIRLQNQLKDLQFNTAIALANSKNEGGLKGKLLESTRVPASASELDLSEGAFQKAKVYFDKGEWRLASKVLLTFTKDYPLSPRIIDATFLIGESYFQMGRYSDMLEIVEAMASQFPESDFTGFILLRQVQVSISTHQLEEAREICQLIRGEYKNPALLQQVEILEKSLQL